MITFPRLMSRLAKFWMFRNGVRRVHRAWTLTTMEAIAASNPLLYQGRKVG